MLSACGSVGDTGAAQEANDLAIACKTNEALAAAGRTSDAAAMAERNQRAGADAKAAAEAEQAVAKSLGEMRAERQKRTGRRTCT